MLFRMILLCSIALLSVSTNLFAEDTKATPSTKTKKLLLICQDNDGHPRGSHEYITGVNVLAKCLKDIPNLEVKVVQADGAWKEGPALLKDADGAFIFVSQGAKWLDDHPHLLKAFQELESRGGGLSCLHWAMGSKTVEPIGNFVKLFGCCHGGPDRKFIIIDEIFQVTPNKHAVTQGIEGIQLREEYYYRLKTVKSETPVVPLIQVPIKGELETVSWAWERPNKGRSFGFSGMHYHANWHHMPYQKLVTQGVLWTMKIDIPESGVKTKITAADIKLSVEDEASKQKPKKK